MVVHDTIRIGTRGSLLARRQTALVQAALETAFPDIGIEIVEIATTGDRNQGRPDIAQSGKSIGSSVSDKREWILELEEALLAERIDVAVHSAKDVPVIIEAETTLLPLLSRADARDCFLSRSAVIEPHQNLLFRDLPQGAAVGTCSLRRQAQLLSLRPDLKVVSCGGNVNTRIRKLAEQEQLAGIVLACAGLDRLEVPPAWMERIPNDEMVPAVNQGIIVGQILRRNARNDRVMATLQRLVDPQTLIAWRAERRFVEVLGADCRSAACVYCEVKDSQIAMRARVLSPDGTQTLEGDVNGEENNILVLASELANDFLSRGAAKLLQIDS